MANPIVTSLPDYVEQNRLPLLKEAMLDAPTIPYMTVQTGIKGSAAINYLSTDVTLQDGKDCGWNEAGTATLTQRVIKTGIVKVNMSFCERALIGKWAESQVRIAAGREKLPFEEEFINGVIAGIQQKVDKLIWNGDTSDDDSETKLFDGILKNLTDANAVEVTIPEGTAYRAAVTQVLLSIPAAVLQQRNVTIFCAPEFLMGYGQEMVSANLYHFEPGVNFNAFVVPGTNVRIVAVAGLAGVKKLVATYEGNIFYGTDMESDSETFKFWYSDDNQEFRLAVKFNAGTQVAFPDECVVATYTTLGGGSAAPETMKVSIEGTPTVNIGGTPNVNATISNESIKVTADTLSVNVTNDPLNVKQQTE